MDWLSARKALLTFAVAAAACFGAIRLFAPSPATLLSGPAPVGPGGAVAHVSFSGAPTGLAIGISVGVGLIVLLVGRIGLLVGHPRSPLRGLRRLRRAEAGQAVTEFILVFWALFMVVMGVAQMSLMYNAKNVTLYAAYAAARSAIVWIPQDDGEPANQITLSTGEDKYSAIHNSAAIACVPISRRASHAAAGVPIVGGIIYQTVNTISQMLQSIPGANLVLDYADRFAYSYFCTKVKFVQITGGGPGNVNVIADVGDSHTFQPHSDVSVQVTHCFHLNIPLAAQLIGPLSNHAAEFPMMAVAHGEYTLINATCTLTVETP